MQTAAIKTNMTNLETIKEAIAAKMDSASFTSWIAPLNFSICDGDLVLSAQNQFSADFIGSVHSGVLNAVAAEFGLGLKICVRNSVNAVKNIANDNNVQVYAPVADVVKKESDEKAFDSFVACEENAFVFKSC